MHTRDVRAAVANAHRCAPTRKRMKINRRTEQSFSHATHLRQMSARHPLRLVGARRGHDAGDQRMMLPVASARGAAVDGCDDTTAEEWVGVEAQSVTVMPHLFVSNINGLTHKI
jgi:hypothetical protein